MTPRAVLLDLDGTIYQQGRAIPGAALAVRALKERGLKVGFVTNTTSRPRRLIRERCALYGFDIAEPDITTALLAGARHLRQAGLRRVFPVLTAAAREDLAGFELVEEGVEAVVVGDIDPDWNAEILNRAFRLVLGGARLIALSKDRYWLTEGGLRLDSGTFVAALEYATGATAELCGKPSAAFYRAAIETIAPGTNPEDVLMAGDDVWSDIDGAQRAGLRTCLVRTGKFRQDVFERSGIRPDALVESVADLVSALDSGPWNLKPDT